MREMVRASLFPGRPPLAPRVAAWWIMLLVGALVAPAQAADFQAGLRAYERNDYEAALKEFRPLAKKGHAEAQYKLGIMYDVGKGVSKNDAEAVSWYRKAAEQGHVSAQYALGVLYYNGEGVPQDYEQAYAWFDIVASQGDKDAERIRDDLANSVLPRVDSTAQRNFPVNTGKPTSYRFGIDPHCKSALRTGAQEEIADQATQGRDHSNREFGHASKSRSVEVHHGWYGRDPDRCAAAARAGCVGNRFGLAGGQPRG